jgi:DNA mismatch endonuclease (patch repair protein)
MDNLSKEHRRKNMQHIRSKNTLPELLIMKGLKRRKIYFTKYVNKIIGKPDIVFRRKKTAVFVDSDFWHCNPAKFIMPKSNVEYWSKKIEGNKKRDKIVNETLEKQGWKVLWYWESDIKKDVNKIVEDIINSVKCPQTA